MSRTIRVVSPDQLVETLIDEGQDLLRPDDREALRAITALSAADALTLVNAIRAYYGDVERADRTPRGLMYLHIGMLCGLVLREQP